MAPTGFSPSTLFSKPHLFLFLLFLLLLFLCCLSSSSSSSEQEDLLGVGGGGDDPPRPSAWPAQFHAVLSMNYSRALSVIDLWYDWTNGRNFNIIRDQLSPELFYDLEWNNGTSFFYTLGPASHRCRSAHLDVGILRRDWLDGARYLGRRRVDGFLCNAWQKLDFIWYYEDVLTTRPVHWQFYTEARLHRYYEDVLITHLVHWQFYTGRAAHVMTFEVGAVLEDAKWQAPAYCFENKEEQTREPNFLSEHFEENLMQMRAPKGLMSAMMQ